MSARRLKRGQPAIALLESAFHLLRAAPAGAWLAYYLGSVPWVLAFLAYGAEMVGPGRFAVEGAAMLAVGYLGMKTGHAIFARRLFQQLAGTASAAAAKVMDEPPQPEPRWTRTLSRQSALQPWSLFVLPVAFVIGLPFGWAYAYFQSCQVLNDGASARRQAALWPRQNHVAIVLLGAVGLCVFLNVAATIIIAPSLLSRLFGIDSAAARNPFGLFSWTTLALASAVTYLAVGPLAKAVYVLRCFQGEALRTGADLLADLQVRRGAVRVAAVVALLLSAGAVVGEPHPPAPLSLTPMRGQAGEGGSLPEPPGLEAPSPVRERGLGVRSEASVRSESLDRALDRTLAKPEFAWRLPRPDPNKDDRSFFAPLIDTVSRWTRALIGYLERLAAWLRDLKRPPAASSDSSGFAWIGSTYLWLAMLALAVLVGGALLYRRRRGPKDEQPVVAAAVALDPLADASTAATAPSDQWLARAEELLRAGDARHAVRALYLASLSLLAHRQLLVPARSKSNRDYLAELRRRARERPEVGDVFLNCSDAFERVWYGHHVATADLVAWFQAQHGQLARHAN